MSEQSERNSNPSTRRYWDHYLEVVVTTPPLHFHVQEEAVTRPSEMEIIGIKYILLDKKNLRGKVKKHNEYSLRIN